MLARAIKKELLDGGDQRIPENLPLLDAYLAEHFSDGAQPLKGTAALLIQHQLGSLVPMSKALFSLGLNPKDTYYLDIPYTENARVRDALEQLGVPRSQFARRRYNLRKAYAPYQRRRVAGLITMLRQGMIEKDRLLVMDDGSYFLDAVACYAPLAARVGVVEQTTRGVIKMQEDATLWNRCAEFPIINVAESSPKKKLESPFIGYTVARQLAEKLQGTLQLEENDKCLILGYGDIGRRVCSELRREFKIAPLSICVAEVRPEKRQAARKDGYELWERNRNDVILFKLVVGCSGRTSFTVSDRIFLKDGAVLVSASSGSAELSREEFIDLAEDYPDDDIEVLDKETLEDGDLHRNIRLRVIDREITFLNGGFPINFDGRINCVPPKFIQPTHTLQVGAAVQAMTTDETGLIPLNRQLCDWVTKNFKPILDEAGLQLD